MEIKYLLIYKVNMEVVNRLNNFEVTLFNLRGHSIINVLKFRLLVEIVLTHPPTPNFVYLNIDKSHHISLRIKNTRILHSGIKIRMICVFYYGT